MLKGLFWALFIHMFAFSLAQAKNLECIGGTCTNEPGFGMFRSAEPGPQEFAAVCGNWKTDFVVLNDDGMEKREAFYKSRCPHAEVIYAKTQAISKSLDTHFLAFFDRVVERAQREGRKVLFHCKIGVHRTGRLAAYYQTKFEDWNREKVFANFKAHIPGLTKIYGVFHNRKAGKQVLKIHDFVRDPSICSEENSDANCVTVLGENDPKDEALKKAEIKFGPL